MSKEDFSWVQDYLKNIYQTSILENFLELEVVDVAQGKSVHSIKILDAHCNFYGFVHGGTLASVCDTAMGAACLSLGKRIVTIDMNISYIRNEPAGSTLTAYAKVISNGKTIMRATGKIYNEKHQLLVRSQASYYVTGDFCESDHPKPE